MNPKIDQEKLHRIAVKIDSLAQRYDAENDLATGAMSRYDVEIVTVLQMIANLLAEMCEPPPP